MNRDYALPGYIAVALALLFPVYWISRFAVGDASFEEAFRADVTRLDAWDLMFVVTGAMEIYLYLRLRKLLQERLHGMLPVAALILVPIVVGVFHATVVFDLVFAFGPEFAPGSEDRLVVAAAVLMVCCVLQFTIVLGILNVALFPIVLLMLAIFFLRGDHQVEVV